MKAFISTIVFLFVTVLSFAQFQSNRIFRKAKGTLDFPVKKGYLSIETFNDRKHACFKDISSKRTTFFCDSSYPVKAIFDGTVKKVEIIDSTYLVITQYGKYFITYSGLTKPSIVEGEFIAKGSTISNIAKDSDGIYCLMLFLDTKKKGLDPFTLFKKTAHNTALAQAGQDR